MNTKSRIFVFTVTILVGFSVAIMINTIFYFKNYSKNRIIEKTRLIAEIVRDGLTAHMVSGTMDKRIIFLHSISHTKGIKQLWVARSKYVAKQFGRGYDIEQPRDSIDKKVLATGKMATRIYKEKGKTFIRVAIPYIASAFGDPDCLRCHNVKQGTVLGAISVVYNISAVNKQDAKTFAKIAFITLLFILITLLFVKIFFNPYLTFFKNLERSLISARKGNFSLRIGTKIKTKDVNVIAKYYNLLLEKFSNTLGNIESKLAILLGGVGQSCVDPLEKAYYTIDMLSRVSQFKRAIELDVTLEQIYKRIAEITRKIVSPDELVVCVVDRKQNCLSVGYSSVKNQVCKDIAVENAQECRACRAHNYVLSEQFPEICPNYCGSFKYYCCLPYIITDRYEIVIILLNNDREKLDNIEEKISTLKYYLENAKPIIGSKLLMQELKERSIRDNLSGLYNRNFLDEFVEKINTQSARHQNRYGVMMIDIDFFKKVNDTYGHEVGDKVIELIGKTIRNSIRESDIAARYGGEEFVVLMYESTPEYTMKIAENLRITFSEQKIQVGRKQISGTISVGVSFFPDDADVLAESIKCADAALYHAKNSGRNRVVRYKPEILKKFRSNQHK